MEYVSLVRKLFVVLIVALAFAAGTSLGWYARGGELPVGGMPTTTAMQMAAPINETEAGQTATTAPTEGAATSTLAPTVAQPTSTPTASPTPERAEWEIDCSVKLVGALVECMELVTRGSEEPGVARLYWVGRCLPYGTAITLWKQEEQDEGNFWRELSQGVEWRWAFDPTECTRETEVPSPNHIVLNTMAGPGTYRISVRAGGDGLLLKTFFWNAPEASAPTPEPTEEPTATPSGAEAEWSTSTPMPYTYAGMCWFNPQWEVFSWTDPIKGRRWSLWDTQAVGDGAYLVLGFHEPTGEIRWWIGDAEHPCINQGLLAGTHGLELYLSRIGKADLEIPTPPAVGDLDD